VRLRRGIGAGPSAASLIAAAGALALGAPAARADVLVSRPPSVIDCGQRIKVGVWYQSYSGGPRSATITIQSIGDATLARRRVRATTTWRYWYYRPRCGHRDRVRYDVPGGAVAFTVRVRS
jgi:hypothetical protein